MRRQMEAMKSTILAVSAIILALATGGCALTETEGSNESAVKDSTAGSTAGATAAAEKYRRNQEILDRQKKEIQALKQRILEY